MGSAKPHCFNMATSDPNQWLGLLRWSLQYQDGTAPVNKDEVQEMPPEDRKWLEEAMSELVVDEAKRLSEIVDQLESTRKEGTQEGTPVEELFEELIDIVEQIDMALNLHKAGKLALIIDMLRDPDPVSRAHAAAVIATCTQNNPKVQMAAIAGGALEYVTHLYVKDPEVNVRVKAFWAMSCLIRNYSPGEAKFVEGDGIYVVCRGIRDPDVRARTKAVYLLMYLLTRDPAIRSDDVVNVYGVKVQETGLCTDLVSMVGDESVDIAEGVLQVLLRLTDVASPRDALLAADLKEKLVERSEQIEALAGEPREDAQSELDLLQVLSEKLQLK